MAATSIQDQASAMVSVPVTEAKTRGSPTPDVESAAVFESVAVALLMSPKSVLYAAHLARNGLVAAANAEIAQIDLLTQNIRDLTNISFNITDTSELETARVALLSGEDQQHLSSTSASFQLYSTAVQNFLNDQLAKNVKRPGSTSLIRTGAEASSDLSSTYSSLVSLHTDLLDRLYALAVGVSNFVSSPLGTIIGLQTAVRARQDIEDIISSLGTDPSASGSRDFANRLITARSALRLLGTDPDFSQPSLSTVDQLPTGTVISGTSGTATASAQTTAGPFTFTSTDHFIATVNGVTVDHLASTLFQANNEPQVLSTQVLYPVSIPGLHNLFVKFTALASENGNFTLASDGTYTHTTMGTEWLFDSGLQLYYQVFRAPLNTGTSPASLSLATVLSTITTAIPTAVGTAVEFVQSGTSRILIYGTSKIGEVSIANGNSEPDTSGGTLGIRNFYTLSAHSQLGFLLGQLGDQGTPSPIVAAAIQLLYSSILSVIGNPDETLTLTTVANTPGTSFTFSGGVSSTLGLSASYLAVSNQLTLSGSILGVPTNPVNPLPYLDIGDIVTTPTGTSTIAQMSATAITLAANLPTYPLGNISIVSALYQAWTGIESEVQSFLQSWLSAPFSQGLSTLDAAIAILAGTATPATQNTALNILASLRALLVTLGNDLQDPSTLVPAGGGSNENAVVQNVIALLTERNYDKALDFFLRTKIQEMFEMDYQTASYGGSFMSASADVARTDVQFVNTTQDEGGSVTATQNSSGLPGGSTLS